MPVKKRNAKRRIDPAKIAAAWESVFASSYDFFDDLPEIGVETDAYGRPHLEVAREAWSQHGPAFLENVDPAMKKSWGERTFGLPWMENNE